LPVKDVSELIALAKKTPDALNYASSGNGTILHLLGELFKQSAHIKLTHVPYKGTALAIPDLISGQTHLMFDSIVSGAAAHQGRQSQGDGGDLGQTHAAVARRADGDRIRPARF
jgi:tripartite-type tricarboxylate transporter receptor subunit TctC